MKRVAAPVDCRVLKSEGGKLLAERSSHELAVLVVDVQAGLFDAQQRSEDEGAGGGRERPSEIAVHPQSEDSELKRCPEGAGERPHRREYKSQRPAQRAAHQSHA